MLASGAKGRNQRRGIHHSFLSADFRARRANRRCALEVKGRNQRRGIRHSFHLLMFVRDGIRLCRRVGGKGRNQRRGTHHSFSSVDVRVQRAHRRCASGRGEKPATRDTPLISSADVRARGNQAVPAPQVRVKIYLLTFRCSVL